MATLEKLEDSKIKLKIEVSAEQFEEATQKAYRTAAHKFAVPGFRKGKAPRRVIENMYGPMAFFDDAFDVVYPEAYEAAIREHNITPVDRPEVSISDFSQENGLVFEVEVAVKPEVKLGVYKGIEVEKREYNVTDEEVDAALENERTKVARMIDIDRPAQNGDSVNLDYSGSVDGVKFEGGTAENQTLILGSNQFIPGFEDQVIGLKAGDEKDIEVTFPEKYHAEALAGKPAVFHVKVNMIQVKELPALDDEFAKDVSEFDSLKAFREAKKAELLERAQADAATQKENEVIGKAVENAELVIPEAMVLRGIDQVMSDMSYRLSSQGISIEDYYKYVDTTAEAFREKCRPEAEMRVKSQLVIEAIIKAENIEATKEEIDEKAAAFASQYGDKGDELLKRFTEEDKRYFEDQIVTEKVIKIMVDSAKETGKKKAPAKAPAKTPAKKAADKSAAEKKEAEKKPDEKAQPAKKPRKTAAVKTEEAAQDNAAPAKKPAAKKPAAKKPAAKKPTKKTEEKEEA